MGCGSSAAAVHSEAPLAREPLRATQRQQQRRPVYTEVVQCSGCGVIARVAFGVAFCDQCTTKLDIAAKIQQANIDSLNTTDIHSTTEVISGTDIDESELPAPPEQSVLNSSAPSDNKQEQSLENIKIPSKADALKSRFSQNGRAIYTIVETSEENSRTATPPPPIKNQTTHETSEENSRTATQALPNTRQKKVLSKSISITVEDRDTGIKEEIFQITLDHQTGQTYTFEETSTDANEKDIAQELNSQEEAKMKESENETPSNRVEAEDINLDKKCAKPEKQKRINELDADTETPEHLTHGKAADEPADEQQKEEEDTATQSQHEHTVASETHTTNSTGEPQDDRQEITKEEMEDKTMKGTAKAEKSHNEETVDTTDAEEGDDLPESSQEMAKKDSQAEESNEMAEAENSHNERKPDEDHSKSMMESVEGNDNKRINVKISITDSNENSRTTTLT